MKRILAIETATEACSVALEDDGQVAERFVLENRAHGDRVLPWVAELMEEAGWGYADLDAIAVSRGPGGFTSLRIGISVAQGLSLAASTAIHPVSSLATLALEGARVGGDGYYLAVLDARMGEVYFGTFQVEEGRVGALGDEGLCAPEHLPVPDTLPQGQSWVGCGSGFSSYGEALEVRLGSRLGHTLVDCWPRARSLLALAPGARPVSASRLEPVYLRDKVTG